VVQRKGKSEVSCLFPDYSHKLVSLMWKHAHDSITASVVF
jgi:hypothetical protein